MSVEVLGKVVGIMTARLVTMEGKGSISLIEINRRQRDTVCRERLSCRETQFAGKD